MNQSIPMELLHHDRYGTGHIGYMIFDLGSEEMIFVVLDTSDFMRWAKPCWCGEFPNLPHVHPDAASWEPHGDQWRITAEAKATQRCLPKNRSGRGWFDRCTN